MVPGTGMFRPLMKGGFFLSGGFFSAPSSGFSVSSPSSCANAEGARRRRPLSSSQDGRSLEQEWVIAVIGCCS
jgi:hypothetical protein